jgi:ATP-dependent Clp protease protease subunit
MEPAILKIYGDIGESIPDSIFGEGQDTISAKDVSEFLDQNKNVSDITVKINSRGGDVQEGWAILDLLTTSGKRIKTIGEGKIYSIATILFLAGTEREIMKNADGQIHNPYIPPYTLADSYESEDLIKIAESLKQEEAKILDFYVQRTGSTSEILAPLMSEDTKLSAEDMLKLGFATKIVEPILAYAYFNLKNKFEMNEKDVKTFGEKLDIIIDKFKNISRLPSKNQVLKDKDGKELTLEKETGVPAIGDKATPDGTFVMESGNTITVSGGVITTIEETVVTPDELEEAKAKIAELEAEMANMKQNAMDVLAEKENLKTETEKAVAMITELQGLKNSWKPDTRTAKGSAPKVGDIDLNRVKEIMDQHKNDK